MPKLKKELKLERCIKKVKKKYPKGEFNPWAICKSTLSPHKNKRGIN